jgi:catechol 1,2-dioxygenase
MIIRTHEDVTTAVLAELERATDPRFKEIMIQAVKHLHGFVRDARLTEAEFHQACAWIAQLGQLTTASHNEVVLISGSLGISSLVCLLNNGDQGQTETTANLMGPFWRENSPRMAQGSSIVQTPTAGVPLFVKAWVRDQQGRPIECADVDIWQTSGEGYYENQDPEQSDMNLRGKFTTDHLGHIAFQSVKPGAYPLPLSGPVGALLRAQGRHNMRPAHIHFMIHKNGYKTQFSQVYSSDDPHLETDAQFGVTQSLIGQYVLHSGEPSPLGDTGLWYSLDHHFVIEPGQNHLPKPPITGKSTGERPVQQVLARRAE